MPLHQRLECTGAWMLATSGDGLVCTGCGSSCPIDPAEMMAALRENSFALLLSDLANHGRKLREFEDRFLDP